MIESSQNLSIQRPPYTIFQENPQFFQVVMSHSKKGERVFIGSSQAGPRSWKWPKSCTEGLAPSAGGENNGIRWGEPMIASQDIEYIICFMSPSRVVWSCSFPMHILWCVLLLFHLFCLFRRQRFLHCQALAPDAPPKRRYFRVGATSAKIEQDVLHETCWLKDVVLLKSSLESSSGLVKSFWIWEDHVEAISSNVGRCLPMFFVLARGPGYKVVTNPWSQESSWQVGLPRLKKTDEQWLKPKGYQQLAFLEYHCITHVWHKYRIIQVSFVGFQQRRWVDFICYINYISNTVAAGGSSSCCSRSGTSAGVGCCFRALRLCVKSREGSRDAWVDGKIDIYMFHASMKWNSAVFLSSILTPILHRGQILPLRCEISNAWKHLRASALELNLEIL